MSFNVKEINKARNNRFIFVGKTGSGKSTLMNILLGENIYKVKRSANAVTTETKSFYYQLKNGRMDTPGLSASDRDDVEEMKKEKDSSNKKILMQIMEKVKNVSDAISYNELQTKYFNSYWPLKEEKKKKQQDINNKNKEELEVFLNYLSEQQPLFSKIEFFMRENYPIEHENKKYKTTIIVIGYFDLKGKIKEDIRYINPKEISNEEYELLDKNKDNISNCKIKVINAERNNKGEIEVKKKDGDQNNSYYYNMFKNTGIAGIIGGALGAVIFGGAIVVTGGMAAVPGSLALIGGGAAGGGIFGALSGFLKSLFD